MSDHFEVEKKYRLSKKEGRDLVEKRLRKLGFAYCGERQQYDHFIPGTGKNELLRVRVEDGSYSLTWKERVRIGGKRVTRESEPHIHPIAGQLMIEAASRRLGKSLPMMFKRRKDFKRTCSGFEVNVVIDYAPELAKCFSSYFMEIEIIIDDPVDMPEAKRVIDTLAGDIFDEPRKATKKSYRRMLFAAMRKEGKFPKRWGKLSGSSFGQESLEREKNIQQ